MRALLCALPILFLADAAPAQAQADPHAPAAAEANPMSAFTKQGYEKLKEWTLRSAEKMPEESYGFRPVETVRTFGQILGHLADSQIRFCSAALGEASPAPKGGEARSAKGDVIASLKSAFGTCDRAYAALTDANGTEPVKFVWGPMPRLHLLTANDMHMAEHYGSLTTYLRMKAIVPPSSEPGGTQPPKK